MIIQKFICKDKGTKKANIILKRKPRGEDPLYLISRLIQLQESRLCGIEADTVINGTAERIPNQSHTSTANLFLTRVQRQLNRGRRHCSAHAAGTMNIHGPKY